MTQSLNIIPIYCQMGSDFQVILNGENLKSGITKFEDFRKRVKGVVYSQNFERGQMEG